MTSVTVLEEPVLVLDKNFMPVAVVTVREAFSMLCRETAVVLDKYVKYDLDDWITYSDMVVTTADDLKKIGSVIHTQKHTILVPDVILVTEYSGHSKAGHAIRYSRSNIFQRDAYVCQYCGEQFPKKELTLDHIIPKSKGGKASWSNIVTACRPCNMVKGNRTPEQANMKLINHPSTPTWRDTVRLPKGKETWTMYL